MLANLGQSLAHVKYEGPATLGTKIYYLEKSPLGWVNMLAYNFFVSGPGSGSPQILMANI